MPLSKLVRHQQRHVVAHHQLHLVGQARALAGIDRVFHGEGGRDVLVHLCGDTRDVGGGFIGFGGLGGFGFLVGLEDGACEGRR